MPVEFDEEGLMDRVDGDLEFLGETLEMLEEDYPDLIEEVQNAAASGDAEALAKSAHTLKGMFSNFCAEPAEAAARELEMKGRQNEIDGAADAVVILKQKGDELRTALHRYIEQRES